MLLFKPFGMTETMTVRLTNGTDERGNLRFVDVRARRPPEKRRYLCPVCSGPTWAPQIDCGYHRERRR